MTQLLKITAKVILTMIGVFLIFSGILLTLTSDQKIVSGFIIIILVLIFYLVYRLFKSVFIKVIRFISNQSPRSSSSVNPRKTFFDDLEWEKNWIARNYGPSGPLNTNGYLGAEVQAKVVAWIEDIRESDDELITNFFLPNTSEGDSLFNINIAWVGPHGVFIVEVNPLGHGVEVYNSDSWIGYSISEPNNRWSERNSVEQCIAKAIALREFLKSRDLKLPILCIVVLPEVETIKMMDNSRVPVCKDKSQIMEQYKQGNKIVDKSILNKVVHEIRSFM